MLRIRKEQIEAFQPVAEADFAARIAAHLRENHGQVAVKLPKRLTLISRLDEESLLGLVKNGVARARSHSFTWASSISAFVVLMFKAAPNFDEHPAIRQSLGESPVEEGRLNKLLTITGPTVWEEVKTQYDPAAWNKAIGAQQ